MLTLAVPFLLKCAWGLVIIEAGASAAGLK